MKKESAVAVVFGIALGAFLAISIISKNKEKQLEKTKTIAQSIKTVSITPLVKSVPQTIEITEPANNSVLIEKTVTVKGKAPKNSLVIIQSPIKEISLKNNATDFSIDLPLALGENSIEITVYPSDKQMKPYNKELKIYYFDEQL